MCLCHLYTSHLALTYSVYPIHLSVLPCMCQSLFFYLDSNAMDQCCSFQIVFFSCIYSIKLHSLCLVIRCFIIVTKLTTWLKHTKRDNAKQNSSRLDFCKFLYILPASNSLSSFSLQNLVKHLPEQEQLNALATYKNEYSNLSEPEQFGVVVSTHNTHKCTTHKHLSTSHQLQIYGTKMTFSLYFLIYCRKTSDSVPFIVDNAIKHKCIKN